MKKIFYLAWWFFQARFLKRQKPLQTVIFITDQCNLSCKHCTVYNHKAPIDKSTEQIIDELTQAYKMGSRFVDFEGGEPTLWQCDGQNVNDLIAAAKKIGFYSCTITTNAQKPFENCKADSIWVSLDGVGDYHDAIRGKGAFKRLEENINTCRHRNLSVNMTINTLNYKNVPDLIKYVKQNPNIKSVSFSFHTPFKGTESLFVDWDTRAKIIDQIIAMKREGYPIMNSISGLKLLKTNKFNKECWVSNFILIDGTQLKECPGKTAGVCEQCGFGMAGEMRSVFDFKPDTLTAGLKLRV